MIRVAMISFWHVHAGDYARQAMNNAATEIVAVWDEEPERGHAQAERLGVRFYERLDDLLAQSDIDAVIIDAPTNQHHAVMIAAAQAGKHIFTEKVVAPTVSECKDIIAAVEQAGVKLTVSLPRLYLGSTLAIKQSIDQNELGEITLVRTRVSHDGAIKTPDHPQGWLPAHFFNKEQTLGGAMIDFGCHPMYLARLFLGPELPESVSATYGYVTGREVEDNAIVTLRYANGALAIVEAGFVNRFSPSPIEVYGTEGSLLYGTPANQLLIRSSQLGAQAAEQWQVKSDLPSDLPPPFQQWVTHIQQGTTATENIQAALDLTLLMEAANLSAQTGQVVRLETLAR